MGGTDVNGLGGLVMVEEVVNTWDSHTDHIRTKLEEKGVRVSRVVIGGLWNPGSVWADSRYGEGKGADAADEHHPSSLDAQKLVAKLSCMNPWVDLYSRSEALRNLAGAHKSWVPEHLIRYILSFLHSSCVYRAPDTGVPRPWIDPRTHLWHNHRQGGEEIRQALRKMTGLKTTKGYYVKVSDQPAMPDAGSILLCWHRRRGGIVCGFSHRIVFAAHVEALENGHPNPLCNLAPVLGEISEYYVEAGY